MGKNGVFFVINGTQDMQSVQIVLESYDPDTRHSTSIKVGKLYVINSGEHKTFPVSKLEKKAKGAERSACLGLVLLVGNCKKVRLDQIWDNIGTVITYIASELQMTFVSRKEFAEQPSSSIPLWKLKKRTNEIVQRIKEISNTAIHENVRIQTSEEGKKLMGDSDDADIKMEPEQSSKQNGPISEDKVQTVGWRGCFCFLPERSQQRKTVILEGKAETVIHDTQIANGLERSLNAAV